MANSERRHPNPNPHPEKSKLCCQEICGLMTAHVVQIITANETWFIRVPAWRPQSGKFWVYCFVLFFFFHCLRHAFFPWSVLNFPSPNVYLCLSGYKLTRTAPSISASAQALTSLISSSFLFLSIKPDGLTKVKGGGGGGRWQLPTLTNKSMNQTNQLTGQKSC